ncbi:polysaccharide pyruvyl transferase family protein [Chitinophaga arvensicola]|uniref:Polysaccharide pyruvyl transferase CsaB n=1 Tax=Chitinophaga arvensicola TaxID=29529 RepID=A0A1I0S8R9_9BACT|nr:polysaccharide pyruvyl transferase family protein [Chitinophaga arvensicola]SEW52480.1 polysaccharide pyruvyl transferase CsaB [Chitinophaga arvensicola]
MAISNRKTSQNVLLTGFFGAGNVGDEAVSLAVYKGVKKELPEASFSVVTRSPEYTRTFTGITAVDTIKGFYPSQDFWSLFSSHISSIKKSHLIIIGGGGIIQDVHSWTTIPAYLIPACFGILFNRPVITVGIGVGPVKTAWLKKLTAFTCNRMALVQVRDEESRKELISYGVEPDRIIITADVVPSLDFKQYVTTHSTVKSAPTVAIAFRKWTGLDEKGLVAICTRLISNGVYIRMLGYESVHDKKFYEELILKFSPEHRDKISIHIPVNLNDAMQEVRNADFLLSMRLHGCVFAAAMGTHFFAVPYDRKVSEFMRRIDMEDSIIPMDALSADYADKILQSLRANSRIASSAAFDAQQELSKTNFTVVQDVLRNHQIYSPGDKMEALGWICKLMMKGITSQLMRPFNFLRRKMTK